MLPQDSNFDSDSSNANARTRWQTLCLIFGILIVRLVYLAWLSPLELIGDEAYYWEWSRHLDLCYYEKGPGLAYLITASVRLFGVSEFAVRLPMALLSALATWILARLTVSITRNERAGLFAAIAFSLSPAFQGNAQICTQDGAIILCWIALAAAGLRLFRRWRESQDNLGDWTLVALLIGIGTLFKQSMPIFVPSFAIFYLLQRKQLSWRRKQISYAFAAVAVFVAVISPILIWNVQHHWPTLAHTLGHLGSEHGDEVRLKQPFYSPKWTLSLLGAQLGAIGPGLIILMVLGFGRAIRKYYQEPDAWPDRLWMMCCALPSLIFFFALSFHKEVLGNWPFPSFTTLIVLVGEVAAVEWSRHQQMYAAWKAQFNPRPRFGWHPHAPKTLFRTSWDIATGYGIIAWLILSFPNIIFHDHGIAKSGKVSILHRFSGHRQHAMELEAVLHSLREHENQEPIIVSRYYMTAALYSFYLPGHPEVYNAGAELGKRPSSYDFWAQTDLADPRLVGRRILLDGQGARPWDKLFSLSHVESLNGGKYYLGEYQGIRHGLTEPMPSQEAIGHAVVVH